MPIIIPQNLPAAETLVKENIFVMNEHQAIKQDIRPLQIAILNLMPTKVVTETQLLRVLSNFPVQIEIDLISTETYESKNAPEDHLKNFYKTFNQIKNKKYDGMIITGAPVEKLRFGDVIYWKELKEIMNYTKYNVTSTFHICWAAQAALYYHYGVHNYVVEDKIFGVFEHRVLNPRSELLRGFDDVFYLPHSRYSEMHRDEIEQIDEIEILSDSDEAGIFLVASKDGKYVFASGHAEYDPFTLKLEYERDIAKGLDIHVPKNYFKDDNPELDPIVRWRAHGSLLFTNWLNYFVYQKTPFDINEIK
ncbi:Homoserine O-succinyltransferase [Candidatus Syntrophocurvum alkaliphilum]|uniref:Homoserine O-acetyltransferase n=1 Tax=Candidatus Syntrophocurvum alkaliphilum TaxID=2293317 RepID=A0A6I6DGY9_9FIRM|nr:homoserine O-succinyltransferase [Candidatus Syntrophocurvum alkaliphilum]QGU00228.1 Homoserine O-succinyltransferase [Candidatus Syntrophocurvum alkaliphilum]